MGNHDSRSLINSNFAMPQNGPEGYLNNVYSFDIENSHFVVLSSSWSLAHVIDEIQRNWLERDLTANTKENTFILFHEPAFSQGHKIGASLDYDKQSRDALWRIIDKHNVAAVFSGHEHIFARRIIDLRVFPEAENFIYQFTVGNSASYAHPRPNRKLIDYYFRPKSYLLVEVSGKNISTSLYSSKGILINKFDFAK